MANFFAAKYYYTFDAEGGNAAKKTFSVKELVSCAPDGDGTLWGVNEKGVDVKTGKVLVEVDPKYFRPCEVEQLLGNPTKAKTKLGWNPTKTSFEELVKIMVKHDMVFAKKLYLKAKIEE